MEFLLWTIISCGLVTLLGIIFALILGLFVADDRDRV
jgi:hypothetical protein